MKGSVFKKKPHPYIGEGVEEDHGNRLPAVVGAVPAHQRPAANMLAEQLRDDLFLREDKRVMVFKAAHIKAAQTKFMEKFAMNEKPSVPMEIRPMINFNEPGMLRGGVVKRKSQKREGQGRNREVFLKPLNSGVGGSMVGGALVGQSKISAEIQSAVDCHKPGETSAQGIGQYQMIKKLGSGVSGIVHLVRRRSDGSVWVAKQVMLSGSKAGKGQAQAPSSDRHSRVSRMEREAVLHEVQVMQTISSPYVIAFQASFAEANSVFIIMEFAERGSVADQIHARRKANKRYDESDIWRCLIQVGCGLSVIQDHSIIHRDIKPPNILVDAKGCFKIADFGIALSTSAHVGGSVRTNKGGTLSCMAPEICEDKPYSGKCDVWSMGCTLYEMCALEPCFAANTGRVETDLREIVGQHKDADKRIHRLPACFGQDLRHAISACLTVDPADRCTSKGLLGRPDVSERASLLGIDVKKEIGEFERPEKKPSKPVPPSSHPNKKYAVGGRDLQPWYLGM